jgi:hypothetical protein
MHRRSFLKRAGVASALIGTSRLPELGAAQPKEENVLYNGIRLPSPWPPRLKSLSSEPMAVPYLASPPAVILIDVGRQLFVDNFLIEHTTLTRSFHQAAYHEATPVLRPDQKWEQTGQNPTAMVFSDGVWFDPRDKLFKMWYMGGYVAATCYATSADGIKWDKPKLDVVKGTNIVVPGYRDSTAMWLDLEDKDAKKRFKMVRSIRQKPGWALELHQSPDGIHWTSAGLSGPIGDRTTMFYNPFRRVWVYSIRAGDPKLGRIRTYWENADFVAGSRWKAGEPGLWVGADRLDPQRADLKTPCQLYNLDAVAYESLLLGFFDIWRGQPKDRAKPNEVVLGFSRDGFHWDRPSRQALCAVSEEHGRWNWGNVQSAGGGCLVVGDRLYFYVSGRAGIKGSTQSGVSTTGLAVLRRDGFASMSAGQDGGVLTTRPLQFRGRHLFVNVDTPAGELRVEVLDRDGKVIAPFSRANCMPISADRTRMQVQWKGAADLAKAAGTPVKFRFHLRGGRLYAFWVSPDASGASHGYVAAGGPQFTGPMDTVGSGST